MIRSCSGMFMLLLAIGPNLAISGNQSPTGKEPPARFRGNFSGSARVAVIGGFVVNSYLLDERKEVADLFTRGGRAVTLGLGAGSPLSFARRAGDHLFVRHVGGADSRIEIWKEEEDHSGDGLK